MEARKKQPQDIIVVFESSAFISACYDTILENYLKPLIKNFYGASITDDLGILKDSNGTMLSAIAYKSLNCLPASSCSFIQPTSHPKLFFEKLENFVEYSSIGEDEAHMAEGLALALDIFEDLENSRRGGKTEKPVSTRHVILVACLMPYEDVPVFESNNYRGLKFDEILQSLQKLQVNMSIISPKFSTGLVKFYERANGSTTSSTNGPELRVEKLNNNIYSVLLHDSIEITDFELQEKQQQASQQMMNEPESTSSIKAEPVDKVISNPPSIAPPLTPSQMQQLNSGSSMPPTPQSNYSMPQQQTTPVPTPQPATIVYQNSPQPVQQQTQTVQQQATQQHAQAHQSYTGQPQVQHQIKQQPSPGYPQQTYQPQQQQVMSQMNPQIRQPAPQQQSMPQGVQQSMPQGQQMYQQAGVRQPQQPIPSTHIMSQQTQQPPQQISPNNSQIINIVKPGTGYGIQQQPIQSQMQQNRQYMTATPPQQPQQPVVPNQQAGNATMHIWDGVFEWQQKDPNNPENKITNQIKTSLYTYVDYMNGAQIPQLSPMISQTWPPKITLQLISLQVLQILTNSLVPPIKKLLLVLPDRVKAAEFRQALNIGGAVINLASNTQVQADPKIMLVVVEGNDIVCKIPSDQIKIMNSLKELVNRQKQQQQQQQQKHIAQSNMMMQQSQMNPMQQGNSMIQQGMIQPQQTQMMGMMNTSGMQQMGNNNNPGMMTNMQGGNQPKMNMQPQQQQMQSQQQQMIHQQQQQQGWMNQQMQSQQSQQQPGQQQIQYIQKPPQNQNYNNYY